MGHPGGRRVRRGLKHHTVIFVPHARARFRKWRVSDRQLRLGAAVVVLLLVGSVFTSWSFFTNEIDRGELDRVRVENQELRQVNRSLEESLHSLEGQLGELEERTRQLAIVAGLQSLDAGQDPGIGGSRPLTGGWLETLDAQAEVLTAELDRVAGGLEQQRRRIAATPAISPVRGLLTSGYGYRRDPISGGRAMHDGIDISTSPGREVLATADGVVVKAGWAGQLGRAVYVSHGYGLVTRYGHLSAVSVEAGERVRRGEVIGRVGSTGKSTGYHLHYEVREDGRAVNPFAYLLEGP